MKPGFSTDGNEGSSLEKKTIVVLFGGQSSEHEVSRMSATTILSNMNTEKYFVIPVGITKLGKWMIYNGPIENIKTGEWEKFGTPAIISPDATQKGLLKIVGDKVKLIPVDVIFPVLHGAYGEDGTVQGLLELAQIPYVGCSVLASGISMDKTVTKIIMKSARIPQAKYEILYRQELENSKAVTQKIERKLGYPCFIKPACAGSSVGITKAHNPGELMDGLRLAAQHGDKLLIEEFIDGREVETGVLGNGKEIQAACVGEVFSAAEFYDYDAKYNNANSKTVVPAEIEESISEEIRRIAIRVFQLVDGSGLARVDFFIQKGTNKVIFNELNTMPGFTGISMYPMLWSSSSKPIGELIDELINLAISRKK